MTDANSPTPSRDALLAAALEAYLAARQAGESLNSAEFVARHPEIAEDLRACLASLHFLEHAELRLEGSGRGGDESLRSPAPAIGTLGDFHLQREIGRGGMGVVYQAEQISLRRPVALKILPLMGALDKKQLIRFHNEATAAASLHHPHIVPIYGIGQERGIHYYAMQLVEGVTIAEVISQLRDDRIGGGALEKRKVGDNLGRNSTTPLHPPSRSTSAGSASDQAKARTSLSSHSGAAYYRRVVEIAIQALDALEYAHQHGIVHRDITPSNLMLDGDAKVWVMDFGLAAVDTHPQLTMTGDLLGTLRYMSPEQASGDRAVLDQRTDIYSLGATLYELLTLQPVHGASNRVALLKQVTLEEPRAPRRVVRHIPAELEMIVLKALANSPSDRYGSASAMADDLRRFLDRKPIKARPISAPARAWRWALRNPDRAGLAALATLSLVVLLVGSMWYRNVRAGARLQSYYAAQGRIQGNSLRRPSGWIWENVEEIRRAAIDVPDDTARQVLRSELARTLAGHDLRRVATLHDDVDAYGVVWSHDSKLLAVGENAHHDGAVLIHLFSGNPLRLARSLKYPVPTNIQGNGKPRLEGIRSLLFTPDDRQLFAGTRHGMVLIFDVERGELTRQWQAHSDYLDGLLFPDDETLIITGSKDATIKVWRIADERCLHEEKLDGGRPGDGFVKIGAHLIVNSSPVASFSIRDAEKCVGERNLPMRRDQLEATPDEDGILGASADDMYVFDKYEGELVRRFFDLRRESAHGGSVTNVKVSPEGCWVVSTADRTLHLWDFLSARPLATALLGGHTRVESAFRPGSNTICVTGNRGVHIYEIFADPCFQSVMPHSYPVSSIDLTPSGKTLVAAVATQRLKNGAKLPGGRVCFLDEPWTGEPIEEAISSACRGDVAIAARGDCVAICALVHDELSVRSRAPAASRTTIRLRESSLVSFSADGQRLWLSARAPEGTFVENRKQPSCIAVIDLANPQEVESWWFNIESQRTLQYSTIRDIKLGVTTTIASSDDQTLRCLNASAEVTKEILLAPAFPDAIALSGDEAWSVAEMRGGELMTVNLQAGSVAQSIPAHFAAIADLALAKTGLLVSGCKNGEICFWQFTGGRLEPLFRLEAWTNAVKCLRISDDGRLVAALLEGEGGVRLIHVNQLRSRFGEIGLDWTDG